MPIPITSLYMQIFFATAPKGIEDLLALELTALGATNCRAGRGGVTATGTLATIYGACLWSRLANRILLPIHQAPAPTPEALYEGVRQIHWQDHLGVSDTLAVDFASVGSAISHTQYGALKVKDAVVDYFRDIAGTRPSIDTETPSVRINVYVENNEATVNLDLSGSSLHRRGYRWPGSAAPLKENLASAMLLRLGWPALASQGAPFVDPMCGSGTLVIEAALMAGDVAPGLLRRYFGFLGWRGHAADTWQALVSEARERQQAGAQFASPLHAADIDPAMVRLCQANAARAGMANKIIVREQDVNALTSTAQGPKPVIPPGPGLVAMNPPYGERMGHAPDLFGLYARLGQTLKDAFAGYRAGILTYDVELGKNTGLKASKVYTLYNGALRCSLLSIDIYATRPDATPGGATDFINRLRKNYRKLQPWAAQRNVDCYRVYDADLPEYAIAVDIYGKHVHVQEYAAPKTIDPARAQLRLRQALLGIYNVLDVSPDDVVLKVRQRQKGLAQYDKLNDAQEYFVVREGNCEYYVNLRDYLDTGLFLDHRPLRRMVQDMAAGKRFLNLFGYTGSATISAARGGAVATTTVDMSRSYLRWTAQNLRLNNLPREPHQLIQADCIEWLASANQQFDLILLDPPTFSNSKRMRETLDVQRDHAALIRQTMRLLAPQGMLLFSTNARKFVLEAEDLAPLQLRDISSQTIDTDFARNPRIHRVYQVTRPTVAAQQAVPDLKTLGEEIKRIF